MFKADLYKNWDLSPFIATPGPRIGIKAYANVSMPSDTLLMPEQWTRMATAEIGGVASYRTPILSSDSNYVAVRGSLALAAAWRGTRHEPSRGYARGEGSVTGVVTIRRNGVAGCACAHTARFAPNAPLQREIFASSADPLESFNNDLFRPRGAVFKQKNVNYLPIGGAGLRGFALTVPLDAVVAMNGELLQRLATVERRLGTGDDLVERVRRCRAGECRQPISDAHEQLPVGCGRRAIVARGGSMTATSTCGSMCRSS